MDLDPMLLHCINIIALSTSFVGVLKVSFQNKKEEKKEKEKKRYPIQNKALISKEQKREIRECEKTLGFTMNETLHSYHIACHGSTSEANWGPCQFRFLLHHQN